jgi:phosphatidylserine/phosphatidylglycerophosphate/cardiolipin synthase-like enzyme
LTAPLLNAGHEVRLLQGGAEFFPALVDAIDTSVEEVRLETYIFNFDATGRLSGGGRHWYAKGAE